MGPPQANARPRDQQQPRGVRPSLAQKEDQYQTEEAAIARLAAALVQPGDTIFLDAGSTTRQIAHELRHHRNVTVVTNALNVAGKLAASDLEVILTGRRLGRGVLSQVGPIAEQTISGLYVDKLFLAVDGVDPSKGVTTPNVVEARTKRPMVENAREVFLVADHSKFGRVTFGRVCRLDRLHAVVTDDRLPERFTPALRQRGVKLHVASTAAPVTERRRVRRRR